MAFSAALRGEGLSADSRSLSSIAPLSVERFQVGEMLDYNAFDAAPLKRDPFEFIVVPEFIPSDALEELNRDFPEISEPGSYPIESLSYGPAFQRFVEELKGPEMTRHFSEKFGIDLTDHPIMATVREYCQESDGAIHTDSKTKVITILFYFNQEWPHEGGRLRLLRSAEDLEDYEAEVSPEGGAMLAFRRSNCSYHGHKPFSGHRRILQMHWVDPKRIAKNERKRRSLWWKFRKALEASPS